MEKKYVLITGSSRGLGRSLAKTFSEYGFSPILHGRDQEKIFELVEFFNNKDVECKFVIGDITERSTIEEFVSICETINLEIVINNAGIYLNKSFSDTSAEEFRKVIDINCIAPILVTQALFPLVKRSGKGVIININSIAGKTASRGEAAYCASKHALRGFSNSIQYDATDEGVRVANINLGAMNTNMVSGRKNNEKCISPEEAAKIIYELCIDYNSLRIPEIEISRRLY